MLSDFEKQLSANFIEENWQLWLNACAELGIGEDESDEILEKLET